MNHKKRRVCNLQALATGLVFRALCCRRQTRPISPRAPRANDGARRLDKAFRLDNGAGRLPARPDQPVDGTATGGGKKQPGATGRATCASQCGSWRRSVLVACVGCRLPLSLVRVCYHIVGAVHNRGLVTERTRVPPTYGPAAKQRDETSLGHVQGGGSRQDSNPDQ